MEKNNLITIVYATNQNQLDLLNISIFSLLSNKLPTTKYAIKILCRGLSEINRTTISTMCKFYDTDIEFIDCVMYETKYKFTDEDLKENHVRTYLPAASFYRLLIPEILKHCEKVIYIDNDTLVLKDLTALYSTEIQTMYGMVKEVNHPSQRWKSRDGVITDYCYNSGVMLINNKVPSKLSIHEVFDEVHKFRRHDQDFLNYFYWKEITQLDFWYNFQLHFAVELLHFLVPNAPACTDVINEVRELSDDIKEHFLDHIYILHYAFLHIKLKPSEIFNDNYLSSIKNPRSHIDYLISLKDKFGVWINFAFMQSPKFQTYRKAYELWGTYWLKYKDLEEQFKCLINI